MPSLPLERGEYLYFNLTVIDCNINSHHSTLAYSGPSNSFHVFDVIPSTVAGLSVTGTLRVDSSGWAVKHSEFTNQNAVPITVTLKNPFDNAGVSKTLFLILYFTLAKDYSFLKV
jgi:outer membrane lipoprotein-sorting protein